ncbi:unnamed protein product [Paramecium pentaurelia]|uniref:Uncharacterized protein n=1 Tax=Paramecium pentaurelia TaxID=43138 RepID=A0A8S1YA54_9CILI|nr:unnamed protein product [Paramecium pentaurelia]
MKNKQTQIASINWRCNKCNRKFDLISGCCVVISQTISQITCHSCVKVLQKQSQVNVEQISEIVQEYQQIKAFFISNNLVELTSNTIFLNKLNITEPIKVLLQNSKEFQQNNSLTEADLQTYCKKRILFKQLFEDQILIQKIDNASMNLQSIIKQYFYDEASIPVLCIKIPKCQYHILYSKVLSNYFLILKYKTESEYMSTLKNKEVLKQIKNQGYDPIIFISIYDLSSKANIYEDILIESLDLDYLNDDLIQSYLLEQRNIIYVCVEDTYYQINLNPRQNPKLIKKNVRFQVIGDNLIQLELNGYLKFNPDDNEIIQKQGIFTSNRPNNEFFISYNSIINSFIKYHQSLQNKNEIFEVIHLNKLQCIKRIIFANYEKYNYNSIYHNYSFTYIVKNNTIVLTRESSICKSFLILLNLITNKIIRKIPISSKKCIHNSYLLKNQTVICLKYQQNQVELYHISTGRQILLFEQYEIYPIMQDEQLAISIKQDDIKIFELAK